MENNSMQPIAAPVYADHLERIEIEALWSGRRHIVWALDRHVNILSGINGVGKSTILNKVARSLGPEGILEGAAKNGVHLTLAPAGATRVRLDVIRSFDRPLVNAELFSEIATPLVTDLDWQLYKLQRKYLDYQVNIGNRIIAALQAGGPDAADVAQRISAPKRLFQDMVDRLFADTGKRIVREANEIRFSQIGETLLPYQLSSGEKQMLVILLTVLVQDGQPTVLFMDEPEVSLHIEWQQQLIENVLLLNPAVQIILTTHSPAVVMNGWVDRVTEVGDIIVP